MPVKRKLLDMRNFPLALRSIMTSVYVLTYFVYRWILRPWNVINESNSFRIGFLNLPYFNFEFSWNFTELCEPQFIFKKIEMWANTAVVSLPYWIEGNVSIRRVDITDGKVRRYMLNFHFYFLKNREANSSVFWKTYGPVVLVKLNHSL